MRVANNMWLLDGACRSAIYDLGQGFCYPLDDQEKMILLSYANGNDPLRSNQATSIPHILSIVKRLAFRGILIPGRPCVIDLRSRPEEPHKKREMEHVWLEITNSCNLVCSHCYAESGPEVSRANELTNNEWLSAINNLFKNSIKIVTFIGGEPLVRHETVALLIKHIRSISQETTIRIFSNLTIETALEKIVPICKNNNVHFGTSLYGTDASAHDALTRRAGSWEKTVNAIRELVALKIPVFVGFFRNELAAEKINDEKIKQFLKELGVTDFGIQAPSNVGRGKLIKWKFSKKINTLPSMMTFSHKNFRKSLHGHNCYLDHLSIQANGMINPCIMTRNISYGNAKEMEIDTLFHNAYYLKMSGLSKDAITGCKDCEFRYACFDCRPDAIGVTDDLLAKPKCGYDPTLPLGHSIKE